MLRWQREQSSKRARVGGQGFDPCLLYIIFLNIYLQIQCYHSQRSHLTPQIHHLWINQHPYITLPMKLPMMDLQAPNNLGSNAGYGPQDLGFWKNSSTHHPIWVYTPQAHSFALFNFTIFILFN